MNEVILEELIGKVTSQGKALQAVQEGLKAVPDHAAALQQIGIRIDGLQSEIGDIPQRISIPEAMIQGLMQESVRLKEELKAHSMNLQTPMRKEVRHQHHLNRAGWVVAGLVAVCLLLIVLLVNAVGETRQHTEEDVKYRYLRLSSDPGGLKALDYTDSIYRADPDGLEKEVVKEEGRRQEEWERLRRLDEKKKEVRELEGKK